MTRRTVAIGDIHGDFQQLTTLFARLPPLERGDTLVLLGDYLDRGPAPAAVVDFVRSRLPAATPARIVALRGSHEDAWLKVRREGWIEFILPTNNGCLSSLRSFTGQAPPAPGEVPTLPEYQQMERGAFFPQDVIDWLQSLPCFHEDDHAIYVHAGLPQQDGGWLHPAQVEDPKPLLWQRSKEFFSTYHGKRVVFGHTSVEYLPQELSCYTPGDPRDVFLNDSLAGIDTGCGRGGFLTAIELPSLAIYDSR